MHIYLTCRGCAITLRVIQEHAGKRVRCPRCRTVTPLDPNDVMTTTAYATRTADLGENEDDFPIRNEDDASERTDANMVQHPHPKGYILEVQPDGCLAELVVTRGINTLTTAAAIHEAIRHHRITFGLDDNRLTVAIMALNYPSELELGQRFTVATGRLPTSGSDGYIDFLLDVSGERAGPNPQSESDGRVDYKAMSEIPTVTVGTVVARRIPPEPGHPGIGIDGRPISAEPTVPASLQVGEGIELGPDGQTFIATIEGRPIVRDEVLSVLDVFMVDGDVDMSTGNISFNGHVVIKGNVLDEFHIRCKTLEVHGTVGSAFLECSGDAELKGGVNGLRTGMLRIGGHCSAKYLNEVNAEIRGNLTVERGLTNSNIGCTGTIEAERIIGGRTTVLQGLVVNYLGSELGVTTTVLAGTHFEMVRTRSSLDSLALKLDQLVDDVATGHREGSSAADEGVEQADGDIPPIGDAPEASKRASESSQGSTTRLQMKIDGLKRKMIELESLAERKRLPFINIGIQLYADTVIEIDSLSREFSSSYAGQATIAVDDEQHLIERGTYRRRWLTGKETSQADV